MRKTVGVSVLLAALAISGPALAFSSSDDGGRGSSSSGETPAYHYSGDGFNLSIQRNPAPAADQGGTEQSTAGTKAPKTGKTQAKPGFFQRIFDDLFGDDDDNDDD